MREIAGLRLDPFRREVYREGRFVGLTRKQFAVLEVLVAAEGGVVSAEELLARAWGENAGTKRIRTDHAGVGLGLAIAKSITQAHDGTLTLTPRATGGLRVTVELPFASAHPAQS